MKYAIGQRYISHADAGLGLGIIADVSGRRVTVSFPATGEKRIYAADNAPLGRIRYSVGDAVTDMDERQFTITDVIEKNDLISYRCVDKTGEESLLDEIELSCFIRIITPLQRLLNGQIDTNNAYELRITTLQHIQRLQQSPANGLLGSRTNLLPHQIYIAHEVARRHAPRVLLADEVGLGKTIEAGMILHYQLFTGQATRVLVLTPESLVHQWLVEMLRRFNLAFSVFDESRIKALQDSDATNPFESAQLVLCNLALLSQHAKIQQAAIDAGWDIIVVDEAHHLRWSPMETGDDYRCVEALAAGERGLLLLTATPEQLGLDSHFARLRLLDPARFHDLETFRREAEHYQSLNTLIQQLLDTPDTLDKETLHKLEQSYGIAISGLSREQIIRDLLDRHGVGRVLFRNTRATVRGFPERHVNTYTLPTPADYAAKISAATAIEQRLYPEQLLSKELWPQQDPRINWLVDLLKQIKPEKALVICHRAATAITLDKHLVLRAGIRSTAFHENLNIIERDRAAAYFADDEQGAQTLICSEIGSEGRNFQFAHHLVLFDLPPNPDLLEQRIGRLDRIGQRQTIQIHVPLLEGTAQQVLFNWYHRGMNLFEQSNTAAPAVFEKYSTRLTPLLLSDAPTGTDVMERLIAETREFADNTVAALQAGRDRLLELNSCNPAKAESLIARIREEEQSETLEAYMERVVNLFGVDHDYHSENTWILTPGDHMLVQDFPGLGEDGCTVTFRREKALAREDIEFLSWEHPMVIQSLEMIRNSETGNATVATATLKNVAPGTLLLETWYVANVAAPPILQIHRYLPETPIRLLIDASGKNLSAAIPVDKLNAVCKPVRNDLARAIATQVGNRLEPLIEKATALAQQELPSIKTAAEALIREELIAEHTRLAALQKLNPSVRSEEIAFIRHKLDAGLHHIEQAALQLQAVRLIVVSPD
jgi:ATP-dependent helicase HepA